MESCVIWIQSVSLQEILLKMPDLQLSHKAKFTVTKLIHKQLFHVMQ